MKDLDNSAGVYKGPLNTNGQPHGFGQLHYDEQGQGQGAFHFIGQFEDGQLKEASSGCSMAIAQHLRTLWTMEGGSEPPQNLWPSFHFQDRLQKRLLLRGTQSKHLGTRSPSMVWSIVTIR